MLPLPINPILLTAPVIQKMQIYPTYNRSITDKNVTVLDSGEQQQINNSLGVQARRCSELLLSFSTGVLRFVPYRSENRSR